MSNWLVNKLIRRLMRDPRPVTQIDNMVLPSGIVVMELFDPDGKLKRRAVDHNLVTTNGDEYIAKRMYSTPTAMTAIMLGTATTTPAKTGAGSFIGTGDYVTGSKLACDASSPKAGASNDIAQYIRTWAAGVATNSNLNRAAIVDNTTDAGEADATHTLAAALIPGNPVNKTAGDSLTLTWNVDITGA